MSADQERWQQAQTLFHQLADASDSERRVRLKDACGNDDALYREVLSLLEAHDQERAVLPTGLGAAALPAQGAGDWTVELSATPDDWIGRILGQYRIESLLGRGGMGAVYLASRASDDIRLRAAVKIISARFTSDWLRQHFLQERQLLATLKHPNIARLIDGGFTQNGEPYLVMEYIEGRPLDVHCQENQLSVGDVVRVYLQLCEAVAYTHRNLVVHRDLKPGNVLVDKQGAVKLLDFGAAKLLDARGSEGPATRLGLRAFTPEYASPEQIFGQTVTASSDVYSLGVILYRLLSGHLPFDFKNKSSADLLRTFSESQPRGPSDAITRAVAGTEPELNPQRIRVSQIRGDLDAIVLKAMRPEPESRYANVDALIRDLRAFLDHRPVAARAGTFRYRARKFIRRHRVATAATAALAVVISGGATATILQAQVAAEEEARARAGVESVRRLSKLLLLDFYDQVKGLPGSIDVQRQLVAQALTYLNRLAAESGDDRELQLELVEAYTKIGNVQGNPYEQNTGDTAGALASFDKGIPLAEGLLKSESGSTGELRTIALLYQSKGAVLFSLGRPKESVAFAEQAAALLTRIADDPEAPVESLWDAASCLDSYGDQFGMRGLGSFGNLTLARQIYSRAMSYQERALKRMPGNLRSLRGLAISHMKLADVLRHADPPAAIAAYRDALTSLDQIAPGDRSSIDIARLEAMLNTKLGQVLVDLNQNHEGLAHLNRSKAIYSQLRSADPKDSRNVYDLATVTYHRAVALESASRHQESSNEYLQTAAFLEQLLEGGPENSVYQGHLAECFIRSGKLRRNFGSAAEGEQSIRRGLDLAVTVAHRDGASANDLHRAAHHLLTVEPEEWRDTARALVFASKAVDANNGTTPEMLLTLARAQKAREDFTAARVTIEQALAHFPPEAPSTERSSAFHSLYEEKADLADRRAAEEE